MNSTKPYFLRAIYDWIVDNNCTPHILVDTKLGACTVPKQHVKDGVIVLNVSPNAVRDFAITAEYISFNARFGGVAQEVFVPVLCARAIYAKENGQGLAFEDGVEQSSSSAVTTQEGAGISEQTSPEEPPDKPKGRKPPQLTVVK
jgi:stringent starvation protein B